MYIISIYNKANIVMFDIIILEIVNKFMIIIYFFLAQKAQQDGYITSAPGYVQIITQINIF